jgi:hypothetical protein
MPSPSELADGHDGAAWRSDPDPTGRWSSFLPLARALTGASHICADRTGLGGGVRCRGVQPMQGGGGMRSPIRDRAGDRRIEDLGGSERMAATRDATGAEQTVKSLRARIYCTALQASLIKTARRRRAVVRRFRMQKFFWSCYYFCWQSFLARLAVSTVQQHPVLWGGGAGGPVLVRVADASSTVAAGGRSFGGSESARRCAPRASAAAGAEAAAARTGTPCKEWRRGRGGL